tara:strand:- start:4486 stop:5157 length:672 start_codon:yes stop_codon:yes gene_type:complete
MNWLEESIKKSKKLKDHYMLRDVNIFIKDRLPDHIDVDFVIRYAAKRLPNHVLSNIDIIYVGHFQDLVDRDVNALWQNGAIYITNDQDSEMDMIDDLIHEVAHSNEKQYEQIIYEDGKLEQEFLERRKKIAFILKDKGYGIPTGFVYNPDYDKNIDDYLYEKVTYNVLWQLVPGIFPSPYAITSLREYWAKGFEQFYMGKKEDLKSTSPILFSKLMQLNDLED